MSSLASEPGQIWGLLTLGPSDAAGILEDPCEGYGYSLHAGLKMPLLVNKDLGL